MHICVERGNRSGMTILEVLVAMLIVGIVITTMVNLIATGDRMAGRRHSLAGATLVAKNEAERLRAYEKSLVLPKDTAYTETYNGMDYDISRTWIKNDTLLVTSPVLHREYRITVAAKNNRSVSLTFRVLQGYYGDVSR